MRPYHIQTETQYSSFKQAKDVFGILGLNADNCGQYDFVIPTDEPRPDITAAQKATKADKPTENPDGSWSYKWNVRDKTPEELAQDRENLHQQIKRERDRRLEADFEFQGKMYQRDTKSLQRITAAGTLAGLYMRDGGDPLSLKWHATAENPNPEDFVWIASDDTLVPMNAETVFAFSREAAAIETSLIFKAKALRSMDPIPENFTAEEYWK